VRIEQAVQQLPEVDLAAAVGVGPVGTQQIVVVVSGRGLDGGLADLDLTERARAAAGVDVAAVLVMPTLPVDIRHRSKIDRAAVARWASSALAGVS
jgi:acyl-CoA synthetase (AMP-forming)/AMP-acid ligase II